MMRHGGFPQSTNNLQMDKINPKKDHKKPKINQSPKNSRVRGSRKSCFFPFISLKKSFDSLNSLTHSFGPWLFVKSGGAICFFRDISIKWKFRHFLDKSTFEKNTFNVNLPYFLRSLAISILCIKNGSINDSRYNRIWGSLYCKK